MRHNTMQPHKPLPYSDEFGSAEAYVESLLRFASASDIFQILCGGVHVLDFFTSDPGLFQWILPDDWQAFLMECDPMVLLDFLLRDDLDPPSPRRAWPDPPPTLLQYVQAVRRHSLDRAFAPATPGPAALPRPVAVGMSAKKAHEVVHFAAYVARLAGAVGGGRAALSHLVDLGSGQNYLGRALAAAPHGWDVVAVEARDANQAGARALDVLAGLADAERVRRNKKVWAGRGGGRGGGHPLDAAAEGADLRPRRELGAVYHAGEGTGAIKYITGRLETGDLSEVLSKIHDADVPEDQRPELSLMAISIHSCGNLSHYGIRSIILNPSIQAVAIVGCCYNLMTEKLGPPTYKMPYKRPSLQAINGRVKRESEKHDPQGFPMSERVSAYDGKGIRFNITARMMACQAPLNWGPADSEAFFTRHFYRAVLQKIFLDRGVISRVYHDEGGTADGRAGGGAEANRTSAFHVSTNPVIVGSLGKGCYQTFRTYVRGAIKKLTTHNDYAKYMEVIAEKMSGITDEEIDRYASAYAGRKRELSAVWTLMAVSASVVESLIVTDRWLFLKEHADVVQDCWVESVFDHKESPRNLVVVGIKKNKVAAEA